MKTYYVLTRDQSVKPEDQFSLETVKATCEDQVWEILQEILHPGIAAWAMTKKELRELKKELKI